MDINFFESADVPQPRDKVRIERFEARPYPDGWRVRIIVDVTPFQERPSLEIRVQTHETDETHETDKADKKDNRRKVAELSVIETMIRHMEFTVHLRGVSSPIGQYVAEVDLYYENLAAPVDRRAVPFTVEAGV